jgi:DNA-binding beta-propeller fold protein YncE/phospholipase C
MRRLVIIALLGLMITRASSQTDSVAKKIKLPNGWSLSPIGSSLPLGDLPLNMIVSPSGRLIAVTNNGESAQGIQLIDPIKRKILSTTEIMKSWYGLAFSQDEHFLYASGGNDNLIIKYRIEKGKLTIAERYVLGDPWPVEISPAGLALDEIHKRLYVVTKENNSLYSINLTTKKFDRIFLRSEAYTCILSPDHSELYISLWGASKILVYNTALKRITDSATVGSHPNDLCLTKNGNFLYVANAMDNSVTVLDIRHRKTLETLNAALYPGSPSGSTTNALALSSDQKTLLIANADNNCLAVFDVSQPGHSTSKGFIPVGWYPTSVKMLGQTVFVANGKGFSSFPNPGYKAFDTTHEMGYQKGAERNEYIGSLFKGSLSIFTMPGSNQLARFSAMVYENSPYHKERELSANGEVGNPVPTKIGDGSPIKHVFYIIKENRTYDQVLGDLPEGNGDGRLCLFGEKITPNLHALAEEFVLLDNFYVDGEVSADGHNWSMGAYANDFLEKTWPTSYGGRGGHYVGEGHRPIANNKNGFIWDQCSRAGVSFRTYGEFADNYKPNIPVLKNHFCTYFTGWDLKTRDTTRFNQWKREFDSLVNKNALPSLTTLRFPNDHTEGLKKGSPTPFAFCADNDQAVGMFIEHLSQSPVWKESVVFILEDDAQDGPDHVDAHRSPAYVAGGFVKRHFLDHTPYSTTSILHTIELILGLPPMSQYDAAAEPLWRCFNNSADLSPYNLKPLQIDINAINDQENAWQRMSEKFDFTREDRIPDRLFSEVIWKAVKGIDSPVPAPRRAAFVNSNNKDVD